MSRITIQTSDLEVEKPSGGGKGPMMLYIIELLLDREVCLHLTRANFKKTGQMEAFLEEIQALTKRK